jgi:alpha-galactosidase
MRGRPFALTQAGPRAAALAAALAAAGCISGGALILGGRDAGADGALDGAPDAGPRDSGRVVPPGLSVRLGDDGRVGVDIDGVGLEALEFVVRMADGSEHPLSAMARTPRGPGAQSGTDASGLSLDVVVAPTGTRGAVTVSWTVGGTGRVQGVELRSPELALPEGTRFVLEGAQSWSFAGALALPPGTLLARDATGAVVYPESLGDPLQDQAALSLFRGDVLWPQGGLSVCATAPYDRWLGVALERSAAGGYVVRVTDGLLSDERTDLTPAGRTLAGRFVLARADGSAPFACMADAPPPARTRGERPFPRGWWSWNTLFTDVTADAVRANAAAAAQLDPSALHVTVDDGWERAWGDWTERDGFGATLADLATELRARGGTLGLWLAPFAVDPAAPLASAHPEWLVHDPAAPAAPLRLELVPGRRYHVLDVTHPDARAYLVSLLRDLRARGVALFKVDFLFAAAHPGVRYDPTLTGLQTYRAGLAAIAEGAGDAHINGCGAVILPALAYVDSMRVGADDTYQGTQVFWGAVAASARNLGFRGDVARYGVLADPDQPVTRGYSADEARSFLAVGALAGRAFGYGDDLRALSADSRARYGEAWFVALRDGLVPPARVLDMADAVGTRHLANPVIDALLRRTSTQARPPRVWSADVRAADGVARHAVALFNWSDAAADVSAPAGEFGTVPGEWVVGDAVRAEAGRYVVSVPAHGVRVLVAPAP